MNKAMNKIFNLKIYIKLNNKNNNYYKKKKKKKI